MNKSPTKLAEKVKENLAELCEMDERTAKRIGGELLTWESPFKAHVRDLCSLELLQIKEVNPLGKDESYNLYMVHFGYPKSFGNTVEEYRLF